MTQGTVAISRRQNSKPNVVSQRVAELVDVTNSMITNIQAQSEINEALTRRLLALEEKVTRLETRLNSAHFRRPPRHSPTPTHFPAVCRI